MNGVKDHMEKVASDTGLEFHNVSGGRSPQEFAKSALEWIPQNKDVDAVLANSSGGFLVGVLKALDKEGLLYYRGEDDHVLVGAVDGYLSDLQWIEKGYTDFVSAQNAVAYGQIAVSLLDKYAIGEGTRDVVPIGETPDIDTSRFYFGKELDMEPKIQKKKYGAQYTVPTYMIDAENAGHDLMWSRLAKNRLGLESESASIDVSPKGSPPSN